MKKRIMAVFAVLLIIVGSMLTVSAQEIPEERLRPRLVDDANLLTSSQKTELLNKLDKLSESLKCDIAVVTVNNLDGKTAQAYADDFYDYNGYGWGKDDSGALLLIYVIDNIDNIDNNNGKKGDWAITTHGKAHKRLSDSDLGNIEDSMVSYLTQGDYYTVSCKFADGCKKYINPNWSKMILIAVISGVIIAFVAVTSMKSKLKTVRNRNEASYYVKDGSLNLTNSKDIFLYHTVTKTAKPKESSSSSSSGGGSHTSSSGRSHGGSSGSF